MTGTTVGELVEDVPARMTPDQWNTIALLLDKGFKWKVPFGEAHETTYQVLLDGYGPDEIAGALRSLVARGQVFGPTPGEIVALIRADPSVPTFDELFLMIYGPRGVLRARAPYVNGEYEFSHDAAAELRARTLHPLACGFILQQRISGLRLLEVDHDAHSALIRKDLAAKWEQYCEANEGRAVAALASGSRGSLARLDPLAALGAPRAQIGAGDGA